MRFRNILFIYIVCIISFVLMNFIYPAICSEKNSLQRSEKQDRSGWLQEAMSVIREMEYEVSWQNDCAIPEGKAGYHMVNRKHNLRLYFYPEGVKLIPRAESPPSWALGWTFTGLGRKTCRTPGKAELKTDKNKIEYNRDGIVESYENSLFGIKHTLTIPKCPKGSDPLNLVVEFTGDPTPKRTSNTCIEFHQNGQSLIQLTDIRANDAQGKDLPLSANLKDSRLLITMEDREAVYPVHLFYLLITPPPWTAESNKAGAAFGVSVCTAGDVNGDGYSDLIIGASTYDNGTTDEGRAFVYHGGPNGPSPISNWFYESNNTDAHLGISVSTAGDVNNDSYSDVIIGAKNYSNDQAAEGAALIFYGSNIGLGNTYSLLESNQIGCSFGSSVSTAGDVNGDGFGDVIVGAEYYDIVDEVGKVFIYKGSNEGIVKTPFYDKSMYDKDSRFGCSVRMAGDVNHDGYSDVIVGALIYSNGQKGEGAAFVFHGGETTMTYSWDYEPNQEYYYFGKSVSTAGDVNGDGYADVVVGAHGYENGQLIEGAIMIFHGSASGLSSSPNLTIESNIESGTLGYSVSTAGDMDGDGYGDVIVGANYYTSDSEHNREGAAFFYRGSKTGLKTSHSWFERSNQAYAEFGYSVSTAGDVNGDGYSDVIVGAPFYDNGETGEGKCFLYYGKPLPPSNTPDWNTENNVANCEFAMDVAGAGDVNGDGYSDVMVGAYLFDNGHTNEGRVFIYYGKSHDVPNTTANRILEVNSTNAYFGDSLASAGDVNADGYDDIIIGAVGYNNFNGRVYLYHGSDTGIGNSHSLTIMPGFSGAHFGSSVSGAGDINGDGYSDVIVGSPRYPNGDANGIVHVFLGTPGGIVVTNQWYYHCSQVGAFFGNSVSTAGDVNGDGYADVIIGAYGYTNGQTDEGRAYVFYGSHNGVRSSSPWIVEPNQAYALLGQSVSTAGDVNGDGYSDVIVGAPYYDNGNTDEGAAFIYAGGSNGLSQNAMIMLDGANQDSALFGHSVTAAGDVNGDGFSDVLIGAYKRDNSFIPVIISPPGIIIVREDAGSAYIYLGSPTGIANTPDWTEHFLTTDGHFGKSVAGAGDVNGDGFADVFIGAPGYSVIDIKYGRAYLYLGGGGNGQTRKPSQGVSVGLQKVGRMGKTNDNGYKLSYYIRSPFGRITVTAEFEFKKLGTPLDGTNTHIFPFSTDLSAPTNFSINTHDFENTILHWRARARYDPVTCPYQSRGPWFSIPWNGWQEGDIRLGPDDAPTIQDVINYLLGRSHYPHDINQDAKTDAADVVDFILNP